MIFTDDLIIGNRRVRRIELRRAERANALSIGLMNVLTESVRSADDRCILLMAQGASFCAGLDLHELAATIKRDRSPRQLLDALHALYTALIEHAAPTACLITGPAVAGGLGLAAATDLLIATADARFASPTHIPSLASIPAAMAHARVPGISIAHWIGWRGRAAEALQVGLVDKVISEANAQSISTNPANQAPTKPALSIDIELDSPPRRLARASLDTAFADATASANLQIEALERSVGRAIRRRPQVTARGGHSVETSQ